jgi:hypothetical protein
MMEGGGGKGRQVAIVAPAREVNAAVASVPREASHPAPPSKAAKADKSPINHESTSARPPSRQEPTAQRAEAKPEHRQEAAPVQSHGQAAQPAPPKHQEAPPAQSHDHAARSAPPKHQEDRQHPPIRGQPAPAQAAKAAPKQTRATKSREGDERQKTRKGQGQERRETLRSSSADLSRRANAEAGLERRRKKC